MNKVILILPVILMPFICICQVRDPNSDVVEKFFSYIEKSHCLRYSQSADAINYHYLYDIYPLVSNNAAGCKMGLKYIDSIDESVIKKIEKNKELYYYNLHGIEIKQDTIIYIFQEHVTYHPFNKKYFNIRSGMFTGYITYSYVFYDKSWHFIDGFTDR